MEPRKYLAESLAVEQDVLTPVTVVVPAGMLGTQAFRVDGRTFLVTVDADGNANGYVSAACANCGAPLEDDDVPNGNVEAWFRNEAGVRRRSFCDDCRATILGGG